MYNRLMKAIDNHVQRLRNEGRPVLASFLKTWKVGLSFAGLCVIAAVAVNPLPIALWLRIAMAVIALAGWIMSAYFKRQWWKLGKEEPEHLDR